MAFVSAWNAVQGVVTPLLWPALFFMLLALALKRQAVLKAIRTVAGETRFNLIVYLLDVVAVAPLLLALTAVTNPKLAEWRLISGLDWRWSDYGALGIAAGLLVALFVGDFIAYWRHRFEHSALLWPSHAMHHSDTAMTWLTLFRFHPVNRLTTTLIDNGALLLLGFPAWAIIGSGLVRHYYGMFIHADLPWTYGPLGRVLVSPAMHRWHHVRDEHLAGYNFATIFSVFDQAFGTYHVPGPCQVPLGADLAPGVGRQLAHPFRIWIEAARRIVARHRVAAVQ